MRLLPFLLVYDYSYDGILRSFEISQQRLCVLNPDMLMCMILAPNTHSEKHQHYWEQLTTGVGFRAFGKLRGEGSTGAVSLGINE